MIIPPLSRTISLPTPFVNVPSTPHLHKNKNYWSTKALTFDLQTEVKSRTVEEMHARALAESATAIKVRGCNSHSSVKIIERREGARFEGKKLEASDVYSIIDNDKIIADRMISLSPLSLSFTTNLP
ncbi:hypothetical protein PUN28_009688 [Cardiocondyla obscurior]|uniref:Uncharacterized protein n=1 Tax=Cardiocondyla obscurior TaxID=286306 RepID=A0AAW2FUZ9_9HYME